MITREDNPDDWFTLARDRLRGADTLYRTDGVTFLGIEALHEAVERFLKGYLVARGWKTERTHNLSHLLDQAIPFDPAFKSYADLTESLTDQFWAQHYPGGDLEGFGSNYDELPANRRIG
jgi:HEPN domain-containing protein